MANGNATSGGRHLVTTADERSWAPDRPMLFLGEWCRRYDRRAAWTGLDAEVAAPYGIEPTEKARDVEEVKRLTARLFPDLVRALNQLHGVQHDARYWQILLGHWVLRYVSVVFNRYRTIVAALQSHAVATTTVFDSSRYSLATTDSLTFIWATNDDVWNHVLCARILEFVGGVEQEPLDHALDGISAFAQDATTLAPSAPPGLAHRVAGRIGALLPRLARDRDALLLSTYLPVRHRLALELSLGQCPQVWRTPASPLAPADPVLRQQLLLGDEVHEGLERLLRHELRWLIPSCYVEGFSALRAQAAGLPWPRAPRFVFTSNSFDTDEVFKAWTAERTTEGIPYITGQHGSNYGTHNWGGAECWPERSASDRFITWGWTDDDPRNVPAFNFRTVGRKRHDKRPEGGLLLIEMPVSHRIDPHDNYGEFVLYQEEQFRFVDALPETIRDVLTVRLHAQYRKHHWGEELRWTDHSPATRVETGGAPIGRLINESRLVVHSYDSTGILEMIAFDTPMMAFWRGGLSQLVPDARPYYEMLRNVGVLHDTPEAAAEAVATHWRDPVRWWTSGPVRESRAHFAERYARIVKRPVRTLRQLLSAPLRRTPRDGGFRAV